MAKSSDTSADAPPEKAASEAPAEEPTFADQQAEAAAAQSPGEPQVVPEQRPQVFVQPDPSAQSASDIAARENEPPAATEEDYAKADSEEQKAAAAEASRTPDLIVGQRVQLIGDHPQAGRMAYVQTVEYTDGIQGMIAASGTPEARFAEVEDYVLRTRDGRSDVLVATPEQVKPLDDTEGWGRGQI